MIRIESLRKTYGNFVAVDGITFTVAPGEVCSFLGVNGAGKTTTLRMLAGILKPTAGRIELNHIDLAAAPRDAKAITGYIPDRPHLYGKLTGREYLYFVADLYEIESDVAELRIEELLGAYRLLPFEDRLVESYSHGMKQRLATCAALIHRPEILIVDEPMVGLDPHGARMLKELFRQYAREGMSILVSTHSLNVAEEISDHIVIIHRGKIIADGTLTDIRREREAHNKTLEEIFLQLTLEGEEPAA